MFKGYDEPISDSDFFLIKLERIHDYIYYSKNAKDRLSKALGIINYCLENDNLHPSEYKTVLVVTKDFRENDYIKKERIDLSNKLNQIKINKNG